MTTSEKRSRVEEILEDIGVMQSDHYDSRPGAPKWHALRVDALTDERMPCVPKEIAQVMDQLSLIDEALEAAGKNVNKLSAYISAMTLGSFLYEQGYFDGAAIAASK